MVVSIAIRVEKHGFLSIFTCGFRFMNKVKTRFSDMLKHSFSLFSFQISYRLLCLCHPVLCFAL